MDLHVKVVSFLKKRYPHSLFTVTLGENQDTVHKRIDSFKKGYLRGSPDLIINNLHKHYTGFCIEFKSPKGNGVLSPDQSMILLQYQNNGFKTLVSNDYDHMIEQVIEYFSDVRIKCSYCPRKFISSHMDRHTKLRTTSRTMNINQQSSPLGLKNIRGLKTRPYSMDMNKDIATLPKKGLKTRPYNIGMEKKGLKKYVYNIDMEKKDLKKLTKGQLIKFLLKKVSNHEDLLDNDPFKDEVVQEPTKRIKKLHHRELEDGKV